MPLTLAKLAETIGATVRGDGSAQVTACTGLEDATDTDVTFLANDKYIRRVKHTRAAAVCISPREADKLGDDAPCALLVADDPYFAFREAVVALHGYREHPHPASPAIHEKAVVHDTATVGEGTRIHAFAVIDQNATIGKDCVIYPHCYVGPGAVVGDDCQLFPNVTVYDKCVLGDRVTLHAGTVIGQDGFGYATHALPDDQPRHHKIPQVGHVVVEDDVEMGANCAIDRGTVGATVIGTGTKFSDLIAIGHGTKVGPHNLLVAQVGLAGSVTTGRYVVMGGQAGSAGHLTIGDGARIAGKAGIANDLPGGEEYGGSPARPFADAKRSLMAVTRLPELVKQVRRLAKRVDKLEKNDQQNR